MLRRRGAVLLRAALLLALGWLALIFAALLRWMQEVEAPHGRLLFPALGAGALLVAAGMPARRKSHWIGRGFLIGLAVLTGLAPGVRILATFAPPRLAAPEAVVDIWRARASAGRKGTADAAYAGRTAPGRSLLGGAPAYG